MRRGKTRTLGGKSGTGYNRSNYSRWHMNFTIEHEREDDGRWIAEVPELPGVLAYGATAAEAMAKAEVLALRVLAERLEHNESGPLSISIAVPAA